MTYRIARDKRRAGVRVVLGLRDEFLLRALARMRLARTGDLLRLFFADVRRDTAATRLRRLHDAGFLQARSGGLSEQNLYQLGPEGVRWAEDRGIAAGRPPEGPVAHHLAIVSVWTRLAAELSPNQSWRLKRFEPDPELRSRFTGRCGAVVPDAAAEIASRAPDAAVSVQIAIEVDLTTERSGELRRKLSSYDTSPYFSTSADTWLVVVLFNAGAGRAASVRALVERLWPGESLVCAESDWPKALLERLSQPPLIRSPGSKGSPESRTERGSSTSLEQGEEPSL
jgi:hypothetical protein